MYALFDLCGLFANDISLLVIRLSTTSTSCLPCSNRVVTFLSCTYRQCYQSTTRRGPLYVSFDAFLVLEPDHS